MRYTLLLPSLLLSLFSFAQVPNYVPTNGLVSWWPFNGNADDESGNGHNGAVNGAVLTSDRFGNSASAYGFNGSSSYILVSPIDALTTSMNTGITISTWLKAADLAQTNTDLHDLRSTNNSSLQIIVNNLGPGVLQVQNFNATDPGAGFPPFGSPEPINANEWVHAVASQDNSQNVTRIYVNGVLTNTLDFPVVALTNPKFTIGSRNDASNVRCCYFNGDQDDIGIWNRALTDAEIAGLYNGQSVPPCISATDVSFTGLNSSYTTSEGPVALSGTPTGGVFIGSGVTGNTFDPAAAGEGTHGITYMYEDAQGCLAASSLCTSVSIGMGVEPGGTALGGLKVFPNPNRGQFTVELDLVGLVGLQVFDARGRTVHNELFTASGSLTQRTLDLSAFAKGSYTLLVQHEGQRISQTVVVE